MTIRLTPKRTQILEVLTKKHGSVSAAEIHAALPDIDLVTIYRNLDLFVREKIIKQVNLGGGEAQYEYQEEPHHHAICTTCERVIHFTAPDARIKKLLNLEGFEIEELEVTVRGTCHHRGAR
jgi:Fur family transcriptional regulator, ferric uptake regulator